MREAVYRETGVVPGAYRRADGLLRLWLWDFRFVRRRLGGRWERWTFFLFHGGWDEWVRVSGGWTDELPINKRIEIPEREEWA